MEKHLKSPNGEIVIDPKNLVGIREITEHLIAKKVAGYGADELDRARSAVTTWISRRESTVSAKGVKRTGNDFPAPIAVTKATGVYDLAEVDEWINNYLGGKA